MKKIGSFLGVVFFGFFCFAGQIKVEADVNEEAVLLGQVFVYQVSISSSGNVDTEDPELPELPNVELQGTSTSSSFTSRLMPGPGGMVFEKSRVLTFNYQFIPTKKGLLRIPPSRVKVDGKNYSTNSVEIDVTDDSSRVAPQQNQAPVFPGLGNPFQDEEDDLYGQLLKRREKVQDEPAYKQSPKNNNEAFFVTVELDKTEVFEGEQIFANWYIYTRGDISQLDRLKFPDLRGFWKEDIEAAPNLLFQQEIINGVPFRKALLASYAIFPIKAGTAVIDEYKIRATVSLPTLAFGGMYGRPFQYTRSSDRVKVNVKPLPKDGKPLDFTGAIGDFSITASVEKNSGQVGQPVALKIRFEGDGNAKQIDLPTLNLPEGLSLYDQRSDSRYFKSGRSYKEFEVLLMPTLEGQITIPALTFSFFDSVSGKYQTKKTEAITLSISPGVASDVKNMSMSKVTSVKKAKPLDLPPIIAEYNATHPILAIHWKTWGIVYLVILLMIIGRFLYLFEVFKREAGLNDHFVRKMKIIKKEMNQGNYRKVGAEGINVMNMVLGQLSDMGGSSLDLNRVLMALPPSLRKELGDDFNSLSLKLQTLSFAPESAIGELKNKEELVSLTKFLEKSLSRAIQLAGENDEKN